MSYDLHIAHACPHYIRYERVGVTNGVLVSTKSPISGIGLLEIRRDGVILSQEGNLREAYTVTPQPSPFRVREGKDKLSIKTTNGNIKEITIPAKIYTAESLHKYLQSEISEIGVFLEGKHIRFTDNSLGVGFTLSGSVLTSMGYSTQKQVVKSKRVTPSWSLIRRLNGYDILFSKEISPEGLIDVSYTTAKEYCRRCNSTGVENDIRWGEDGQLEYLTETDLLYQNVAKAVLTEIGSNPYHTYYGSNALGLLGRKVNSGTAMALRESVTQSLSKIIDVQRLQKQIQSLSPEEQLLGIESVRVEQIGNDQTSLLCNIVVRSGAGRPVSVNVVFAVPGSIPLNGDLT